MITGLQGGAVVADEEASFTVEMSGVCSGSWSLDGRVLRSGAEYLITHTKSTHTLLIHHVRAELNGAELKFVGGGSESTCVLSVKGELGARGGARFCTLPIYFSLFSYKDFCFLKIF